MNGRLLVAYSNSSNFVPTTAEYLGSLARWSGFEVRYVHVTHDAQLGFDLNDFDVIFQSYCVRLPFPNYVSADYIKKLQSFRGIKMLAVQDEYDHIIQFKQAMRDIGYHVLFTNAAADLTQRLYTMEEFPNTEFITVLTGYVPEALEPRDGMMLPLRERPIHIGYRCRVLPAYYGRLGFDKFEIGRRMREICEARGIPHDIEWDDNKRLYGEGWYDFIASCRSNLGSETGSNVFDLDGSIRAVYDRLAAERGGPVPFDEFRVYTDPIEAEFDIAQISPRIFEAAALRTPLILFSGRYLGVIAPDEHYLELKKDFSNVDAVLDRLKDIEGLERMADRAHQRLVASGEFSFRRFAQLIGETATRKAEECGVTLRPPTGRLSRDEYSPVSPAATLLEHSTTAPRHSAIFFHRQAMRQREQDLAELARLQSAIAELNTIYTAEIVRLQSVIIEQNTRYAGEAARLESVFAEQQALYAGELSRLNSLIIEQSGVYGAEIARLNSVINEMHATYGAEIARLNEVYPAEIARLNEVYPAEIARLKESFSREIAGKKRPAA